MSEAAPFFPPFTDEQNAQLTVIWDRLYALYLDQGQRRPAGMAKSMPTSKS